VILPLRNVIKLRLTRLYEAHQLRMIRIDAPLQTEPVRSILEQGSIVNFGNDQHLRSSIDHGHPFWLLMLPYEFHIFALSHILFLLCLFLIFGFAADYRCCESLHNLFTGSDNPSCYEDCAGILLFDDAGYDKLCIRSAIASATEGMKPLFFHQ